MTVTIEEIEKLFDEKYTGTLYDNLVVTPLCVATTIGVSHATAQRYYPLTFQSTMRRSGRLYLTFVGVAALCGVAEGTYNYLAKKKGKKPGAAAASPWGSSSTA